MRRRSVRGFSDTLDDRMTTDTSFIKAQAVIMSLFSLALTSRIAQSCIVRLNCLASWEKQKARTNLGTSSGIDQASHLDAPTTDNGDIDHGQTTAKAPLYSQGQTTRYSGRRDSHDTILQFVDRRQDFVSSRHQARPSYSRGPSKRLPVHRRSAPRV